jgi:predicted HTH domain antitoxin
MHRHETKHEEPRMKAVDIKVPRDLIQLLGLEDAGGLEKHSRLLLAVDLYIDGKVSVGRAAELAGVPYAEFLAVVKERGHKLRVGPQTREEAEKEYRAVKERLTR